MAGKQFAHQENRIKEWRNYGRMITFSGHVLAIIIISLSQLPISVVVNLAKTLKPVPSKTNRSLVHIPGGGGGGSSAAGK